MRYLIYFSYDGHLFHGLERQKNFKTVQGTLEEALTKVLKEPIFIKASGRTDALVHALSQTAHFDYAKKLPKDFKTKLNLVLNNEIIIQKIKKKNKDFHARFMVKEKTYRYIINTKYTKDIDYYTMRTKYNLDIKMMKKASQILTGKHDFHNFISGTRDNYEVDIKKIKVKKKQNLIILEFKANHFYRYMVRHLAGAIYDVGRKKISLENLKKMLDEPNIPKNLSVLPAQGLYLVKVKY